MGVVAEHDERKILRDADAAPLRGDREAGRDVAGGGEGRAGRIAQEPFQCARSGLRHGQAVVQHAELHAAGRAPLGQQLPYMFGDPCGRFPLQVDQTGMTHRMQCVKGLFRGLIRIDLRADDPGHIAIHRNDGHLSGQLQDLLAGQVQRMVEERAGRAGFQRGQAVAGDHIGLLEDQRMEATGVQSPLRSPQQGLRFAVGQVGRQRRHQVRGGPSQLPHLRVSHLMRRATDQLLGLLAHAAGVVQCAGNGGGAEIEAFGDGIDGGFGVLAHGFNLSPSVNICQQIRCFAVIRAQ